MSGYLVCPDCKGTRPLQGLTAKQFQDNCSIEAKAIHTAIEERFKGAQFKPAPDLPNDPLDIRGKTRILPYLTIFYLMSSIVIREWGSESNVTVEYGDPLCIQKMCQTIEEIMERYRKEQDAI